MHIFCPNCGKHIDVSLKEIEKLRGHYVCPQCLSEIDLDGFEKDVVSDGSEPIEEIVHDNSEQQDTNISSQSQPTASGQESSNDKKTHAQPPAYKSAASPPQHSDDVIRYCKRCGAFLRQGVSYCPKCGNYVKVMPPAYRSGTLRDKQLKSSHSIHEQRNKYQQPKQPMASKARNTSSRSKKPTSGSNSPSGIYSIGGCLTLTVIIVAIFFIAYIVLGINVEG